MATGKSKPQARGLIDYIISHRASFKEAFIMQYNFTVRNRGTRAKPAWQLILTYKTDEGKWKQKSKGGYPSRADALQIEEQNKLLRSANLTSDKALKSMNLYELLPLYARDKHLIYSTVRNYQCALKRVHPISQKPIKEIKAQFIRDELVDTESSSVNTYNANVKCLKTLFTAAVKMYKIIPQSPMDTVELKRHTVKDSLRVLTDDQLKHLLSCVRKNHHFKIYVMINLCAFSGIRIGECLGLTWADIDFEKSAININKQWNAVAKNQYGFKPCKTPRSYRTIPIPIAVLDELKDLRLLYPVDTINNRLFNYSCCNSLSKYTYRYVGDGLHCLRHTYATRLLAHGVDIKTVAALLGDSVSTVLDVYVSYTDDMRKKATDRVNTIFDEFLTKK